MIATFPHMGHLHVIIRTLFEELGIPTLPPPENTRRTLEIGAEHSPETVCLPFKLSLGNFMEALQAGADTIVTCGGIGPCRLGYYAEVQRGILQKQGYTFDMIILEPTAGSLISAVRRIVKGKSLGEIYKAFQIANCKMTVLDELEAQLRKVRAVEVHKGSANQCWQQILNDIKAARGVEDIRQIYQTSAQILAAIQRNEEINPLNIGVVGEIYLMLEPFANLRLELKLAELGAAVCYTQSLTEYVRLHLLGLKKNRLQFQALMQQAGKFLKYPVGGHGVKTIGNAAMARDHAFDGVIQVLPFTCMPEVIAKNILPSVAALSGIPVLSLTFDEQSGEAGLMTRLEAFIDLLGSHKNRALSLNL